jgi:hypothetical protein
VRTVLMVRNGMYWQVMPNGDARRAGPACRKVFSVDCAYKKFSPECSFYIGLT